MTKDENEDFVDLYASSRVKRGPLVLPFPVSREPRPSLPLFLHSIRIREELSLYFSEVLTQCIAAAVAQMQIVLHLHCRSLSTCHSFQDLNLY